MQFPEADRIVLVLDNLNAYTSASLYEAFPQAKAKRLADKLEVHNTPKHATWLDMVEIELSVLAQQCPDRCLPDAETLTREVAFWKEARNSARIATIASLDARSQASGLAPAVFHGGIAGGQLTPCFFVASLLLYFFRYDAAMLRPAPYNATPQSFPDANACHEPAQTAQAEPVYQATPQHQAKPKPAPEPESHPNAFHIAPGWIDAQDRTRTWNLMDKNGGKLAEICTKRDAEKLANILNRVREANVGRGR